MKFVDKVLSKKEINELKKEYGAYLKVTIDIENEVLVAGCELHADGEEILLRKRSKQENIWGGGIDLANKIIDVTAVLNLRPRYGNNSMELLDIKKREHFLRIIKKMFGALWQT